VVLSASGRGRVHIVYGETAEAAAAAAALS